MAITDKQNFELYEKIVDTLGQKEADTLVAKLPPQGWAEMATKRDLADLGTQMKTAFVETHAKIDVGFIAADAKMDVGFIAADAKIDVGFIAADAKIDVGFASVEVKIGETNAKMDIGFAEVKEGFADVKEGFAAVDGRFAELSERRGRDVWAFAAAIAAITVAVCGSVFVSFWQFAPT